VTGSGKTEVYLRAAAAALDEGRGVLVLVPEIGLTPQILGRFRARFGAQVAVFHSALSPAERLDQWRLVSSGRARVALGARSAVFAPVAGLGLVVVDEEQDGAYKQEETPRYNARDVALVRARTAGAVALLGSATPGLESWRNGAEGKYASLRLPARVGGRPMPAVTILPSGGGRTLLPEPLRSAVSAELDGGGKAMILLNRRGFSPAPTAASTSPSTSPGNGASATTATTRRRCPSAARGAAASTGATLARERSGWRRRRWASGGGSVSCGSTAMPRPGRGLTRRSCGSS
jgi:primosomal protein N' (replication factor Y)